jgi:enamine deaminase RidA (YjgF/YER057c/UK114 family)
VTLRILLSEASANSCNLGGWDHAQSDFSQGIVIKKGIGEEISQAFANADFNLKNAGGEGWSQVYRVVTYSTDIPSQHDFIVENLRKWMPDHYAVWTELGVKELGDASMHFEIDVEAYDEGGAAKAKEAKATVA